MHVSVPPFQLPPDVYPQHFRAGAQVILHSRAYCVSLRNLRLAPSSPRSPPTWQRPGPIAHPSHLHHLFVLLRQPRIIGCLSVLTHPGAPAPIACSLSFFCNKHSAPFCSDIWTAGDTSGEIACDAGKKRGDGASEDSRWRGRGMGAPGSQ